MKGERMWSILANNIKEIDGNILSSSNQFWGLSLNYPLVCNDKMPDEEVPVFVVEGNKSPHSICLYTVNVSKEKIYLKLSQLIL